MKQVGNYVIEKLIGSGSFGDVYKGRELSTGAQVAVKMIPLRNGRAHSSTADEIKILKAISHPNALSLLDVKQTANNLYVVTELCKGGNLETYIRHHGSPTEAQLMNWLGQLLDCLNTLHSQGILHRDLKLENILVTQTGNIKIADFGLSRILTEGYASTVLGTPLYMAPEVLSHIKYNAKIDVWALGVVAYKLLTGKLPFVCQTISQLKRLQRRPVTWPDHVNENLKDIVELMLTPNPAHRPTASELRNYLERQKT